MHSFQARPTPRRRGLLPSVTVALGAVIVMVLALLPAGVAEAGTASISGVAFEDLDRDGVQQSDEAPMAGDRVYLYDGAGNQLANALTDTAGHYEFTGLADGSYTVRYGTTDWREIWEEWVPTTTGSLYPRVELDLAGEATADFGWRPLVRSTELGEPISTFDGPSGVHVESYNDAVTAEQVHDRLAAGSLLGDEAPLTDIYFGYSDISKASVTYAGSPGTYSGFSATVWLDYLSWLDTGTVVLFHEYGHVWAHYHDKIVQQDGSLTSYLDARGLTGDDRIGSSKAWDPDEMIAEDYRQLFGDAVASAHPQANSDIPPADEVAGLEEFLRDEFTTPGDSAPTVDIASPDGGTVSGTVTVEVAAADEEDTTDTLSVEVAVDDGAWQAAAYDTATGRFVTDWDSTAVADGGHTLTARATDSYGNTAETSAPVEVDNARLHVGDLAGAASGSGGSWTATVTARVDDVVHETVAGAEVQVAWQASHKNGSSGTAACTTAPDGTCEVAAQVAKRSDAVTFEVTGVALDGWTYEPASNHDPDGDSDGTTIVVAR